MCIKINSVELIIINKYILNHNSLIHISILIKITFSYKVLWFYQESTVLVLLHSFYKNQVCLPEHPNHCGD
nr:MAG TPA: hypothetical protein [Bacteriophage sp.]